jgi:PhoPQ-activated pathogenicity-related protein
VCKEADGVCKLDVESAARGKAVRVWRAKSDTRDFRGARWAAEASKGAGPVTVTAPDKGFAAFYAEYEYDLDGLTFTLCTQIRILEAKK